MSCSNDDDTSLDVNTVDFWIGEYEIQVIGGDSVDCNVIFLLPETIIISPDRFQVVTDCEDGGVLIEGSYTFDEGLFELFVDNITQEPEDLPEFEMQIFEDENQNVRIYRCIHESGSCTLRLGKRVK